MRKILGTKDCMESLISILKRANSQLEDGWLYLPEGEKWSFETRAMIIDDDSLDITEVDEDDEPIIAKENGLISTLDTRTIESIYSFAQHLDGELSDALLFESFLYYFENDSFLPYSGFKALSDDEAQNKIDRDFYENLGDERKEVQCKTSHCNRGAISGSAYCKIHHFEMVKKKSCPFND
ncbi:hypothetical protein [Celerinatantimonas sp. MCCC 1A17872]|uniref:DUF7716 domain-containing protein n=1 Tax=Celerinatantimonas sp. MCCC 1A17872 TaxID=3177514 RepID=UPI0038BEA7BF